MSAPNEAPPNEAVAAVFGALRSGSVEPAVRAARALVDAHRESAEAWNALGSALAAASDLAEAQAAFARARSIDPGLAKAYVNAANVERRLRRHEAAVQLIEASIAIDGPTARACAALGHVRLEQGHTSLAIAAYERSVAAEPTAAALAALGMLYAKQGAIVRATTHLAHASRLAPSDRKVARYLEALRLFARDPDAAALLPETQTWSWLQHAVSARDEERFAARFGWAEPVRTEEPALDGRRPIVVGYLTSDREGAPPRAWVEAAIGAHARSDRFVARVFSTHDALPVEPIASVEAEDVSRLDHRELAVRLSDAGVDLVVDCTGRGPGTRARCLAFRPAPIQVRFEAGGRCALPTVDAALDGSEDPARWIERLEALVADYAEGLRAGTRARLSQRLTRLADGSRVFTPASLSTISTVVLAEQGRWFEDEVEAIPLVVREGATAIDVGANMGVYTVLMARAAGRSGRVLAFEPAADTRVLLAATLRAEGLENVRIEAAAVSNREGFAVLSHGASPELNELGGEGSHGERVALVRLERYADALRGLAFVKLDAEGSEEAIVRDSPSLLAREQPVLMVELVHAGSFNAGLVDALRASGLGLYFFSSALGGLIPLGVNARGERTPVLDPFTLNAFAIPRERARALEARGVLVRTVDGERVEPAKEGAAATERETRAWLEGQGLGWMPPRCDESLRWACAAMSPSLDLGRRWRSVERALELSLEEMSADPSPARRLHAARLSRVASRRGRVGDLIAPLCGEEPIASRFTHAFLPAVPRFCDREPDRVGAWVRAQAIAAFLELTQWSIHFQREPEPLLLAFEQLGFPDLATARRFGLWLGRTRALD